MLCEKHLEGCQVLHLMQGMDKTVLRRKLNRIKDQSGDDIETEV